MSSVNVQVHLDQAEWPDVDTMYPVTLDFGGVRVSLGGSRLLHRAEWLRSMAERLIHAAEDVEAQHAQHERDMAATQAELDQLRRGGAR